MRNRGQCIKLNQCGCDFDVITELYVGQFFIIAYTKHFFRNGESRSRNDHKKCIVGNSIEGIN